MKKLIALAAAAMLAMPGAAFADVLADGWQNATLDELVAAHAAISEELDARSASAANDSSLTFSGSGNDFTEGFVLPAGTWIYTVELAQPETGYFSVCANGDTRKEWIISQRVSVFVVHYKYGANVDYIAMEFPCAWKVTATQAMPSSTADFAGTQSAASGLFNVTKPTKAKVTITRVGGDSSNYSLKLFTIKTGYTDHNGDYVTYGQLNIGESVTVDALIKPDSNVVGFVWAMNCKDGFEWSITTK